METEAANRLAKLPPYVFSEIARRIQHLTAQGHDVIRLDMGVPDGAPPPSVVDALIESAQDPGNHRYMPYNGTSGFRQAVSRYYARRFAVTLDSDSQVLPLLGSKAGLVHLCMAYLNPGDLVLLPSIAYPVYERAALMAGAEIARFPLRSDNNFMPDLKAVPAEIAERAKMLTVNYPNNPTGAVASKSDYQEIAAFCDRYDILLVSDNPYAELAFDGCETGSALSAAPNCIEFMSLSKSYNMSGWRLGAAVGNPAIVKILLSMISNIDSGHFKAVYDAGIAALDHTSPAWTAERNAIYQLRRDMVLDALPSIGLQAHVPQGAMYVWAHCHHEDASDYAIAALDNALVSLTPGLGFGVDGREYIRFSLGLPDAKLRTALDRLRDWYHTQ